MGVVRLATAAILLCMKEYNYAYKINLAAIVYMHVVVDNVVHSLRTLVTSTLKKLEFGGSGGGF